MQRCKKTWEEEKKEVGVGKCQFHAQKINRTDKPGGKLWANRGQTVGKPWANRGQTVGKPWALHIEQERTMSKEVE